MIRRTTWIVLVVFILVLVAALVWQRTQDQRAAEATPTPAAAYLIDTVGRQVKSVQFSSGQGQKLEIDKGLDGSWVVTEPAGTEADQARIDQLVNDLGTLQISAKLDTTPGLPSLGLNPAKYRISVDFEDGTPTVVYVGDKTPTQNGYYAYRQGDQVVVVEGFGIDTLIDYLISPPVQSSLSPITGPGETISPQP
jgi:hypothetical protein